MNCVLCSAPHAITVVLTISDGEETQNLVHACAACLDAMRKRNADLERASVAATRPDWTNVCKRMSLNN